MKVTSLFGRNLPAATGPLAPRFQQQLAEARERLNTVRQQHAQLAFNVATGAENAGLEMQQHRAEVAALEAEVADLAAGLQIASAKDADADQAKRLAIHASRVASLRQANAAREKAALRLGAAIENAAVEYANLLAVNERIASLLGAEGLPADSLVPLSALRRAISYEIFRVAPGPADNMRQFPLRFPGGAAPDIFQQGNPSALQSLAEAVKEAGARLLAQIGAVPSVSQTPAPSSAEAQPIDALPAEAVQPPSQPVPEPVRRMPTAAELDAETLRTGPRFVALPLASVRLNPNGPAPVNAP